MKKPILLLCAVFMLFAAAAQARQVPAKGYVTPADGLNIRTGPSTEYKIITAVEQNTQLTILGVLGVWYKVQCGSVTGYSHSEWVKVTEYKEAPDASPTQSARDINLSAERADVKQKPQQQSITMPKGETARETNLSPSKNK